MGANQSADGRHGSNPQHNSDEVKTCYYELLGIDSQATDEDVKKAYRKKALELHPDRNYGNVEETTKLFAEVQSAYEVLSDPQERAWYDSHRSTILRGQSEAPGEHYEHNARVTTSDDLMRVFAMFTGQVDFSDSDHGFYAVLQGIFGTLANEEAVACDWEGLEHIDYPSFGHADDNYEDVVRPFYAVWTGFATKKTFSWMDVYRTTDAPDRRVRRMMEKENRRFRDDGIRDFNDTVRQLVAFVRKRDPRYKPNTQTDAERQDMIRKAASAQAARSRAANRAKLEAKNSVPDWARNSEAVEEDTHEAQDDQPEEQFECVVCRKIFKSEQQFDAHEKSKKHIKAVQRLKRDMRSEDKVLDLDCGVTSAMPAPADISEDDVVENAETAEVEISHLDQSNSKEQDESCIDHDQPDEVRGHQNSTDSPTNFPGVASSPPSTDDEYASREKVEERLLGNRHTMDATPSNNRLSVDVDHLSHKLAEGSLDVNLPPKLGKAKRKRAKKAAQKSVAESDTTEFKCATCNLGFPSKTRLFNHINDFGHAQPVPKPTKGGQGPKR